MALYIDGLLELARLNRSELHPQRVDLSDLASMIVADLGITEPSAGNGGRDRPGYAS